MLVALHQIELSPYPDKPLGVRIVPPPLVLIRWRFEGFGGENHSIASPDSHMNVAKGSLPNFLDLIINKPLRLTWGRGVGGCLSYRSASCRSAVFVKYLDTRRLYLILLSDFITLLDKCPQVLDVARGSCCVVGKLDVYSKGAAMNRDLMKLIARAWLICHDPCLHPTHLPLVLII